MAERLCPAFDLFLRRGRLLLESRFAAWPGPLTQFGCEIAHGSFLNNPQLIEFGFGKVGPKLVENYVQCVRRLADQRCEFNQLNVKLKGHYSTQRERYQMAVRSHAKSNVTVR